MNNQQFNKDEDAQVGIGTMIVFIATILVAAVAAGVLIDTSQKLQDKSSRTGNDAINNVGTAFTILNVWGEDDSGDGLLNQLYIDVQLSAGGQPVDLSDLAIDYNDGGVLALYTYAGAEADNVFWIASTVRDNDGSMAGTVINKDDVVRIGIGQTADPSIVAGLDYLGTNVDVTLTLTTENGTPVSVGFSTPANIDDNAYLRLF